MNDQAEKRRHHWHKARAYIFLQHNFVRQCASVGSSEDESVVNSEEAEDSEEYSEEEEDEEEGLSWDELEEEAKRFDHL